MRLREADRVAERGVLHPEVLANRPDHHLAGVKPIRTEKADPLRAAKLRHVGGELALEVKRRITARRA